MTVDPDEQVWISKDTAYVDDEGRIVRESINRPLSGPWDFLNTYIVNVFPDTTCWPIKETCSFEDFEKLDIRVGLIKACEKVKKSKKLLQFTIDDGTGKDRTILSGIAAFYENPEELVGKRILFVANFAPRQMMGIESQGMILSAVDFDESLSVVTTTKDVKPGSQVG